MVRIANVVFFLAVGIASFWHFPYSGFVIGLSALIVGLGMLITGK